MYFPATQVILTIPAGQALSDAVSSGNRGLLGYLLPPAWDPAVLTLQGSLDGANFFDVFDSFGTEIVFTVAANRLILPEVRLPFGFPFIRVRSGTAASPVNQTAQRVIVAFNREFA
jgi:hypothetical protein